MANTIHVDVVSAEESIFSGEARFVALPGEAGELGIYPRHTPLITRIRPGAVRIETADGGEEFVFGGGARRRLGGGAPLDFGRLRLFGRPGFVGLGNAEQLHLGGKEFLLGELRRWRRPWYELLFRRLRRSAAGNGHPLQIPEGGVGKIF